MKYHILNLTAVLIFSYVTGNALSDIVENTIIDPQTSQSTSKHLSVKRGGEVKAKQAKSFESYEKTLFDTGFFKEGDINVEGAGPESVAIDAEVSELTLIGTITGPRSISRAFIRKGTRRRTSSRFKSKGSTGSSEPPEKEIFKLWETVHGYKLVSIRDRSVILEGPSGRAELKIYDGKKGKTAGDKKVASKGKLKKNLSRAELKQNLQNNMDNAFKGLVAGPYRKNGKVVGFRLKKVRPYNIFYKMGARSGDVITRVNGKKIDSTEKLFQFWKNFATESKVVIDIERRGQMMQFDFNITD